MSASLLEQWAVLDPRQLDALIDGFEPDELLALWQSWAFHARPEQLAPPGDWRWWVIVTGRGWGKNRTGAEWVVDRCEVFAENGTPHLVGLIGQNNDDVKAVQIGGPSGLREVVRRRGHRWVGADSTLEPRIAVRRDDGSWHETTIEVHTAMEPEGPRGRNFHTLWIDELAAFKHKVDAVGNTVFTNAELALRGQCPPGEIPRACVTTTPKPVPVIRDLLASKHGPTHITRGSMLDNRTNLPMAFISAVVGKYAGTRLAEQEIHGKVIDSVEGALWNPDIIHRWRIGGPHLLPPLGRTVVAVDPSGSDGGDECGIVVVAIARERDALGRPHVYVLDDLSCQNRPEVWSQIVVDAAERYGADVVAEVNFGAALVTDTIHLRSPGTVVHEVRATRGKRVRAEPVALLYDAGQGRCHHVGVFPQLEEQMTFWTPLDPTSPDRMDALVWGVVHLIPDLTTPPASVGRDWATRKVA